MAESPALREWPQTRVEWKIKNFKELSREIGFFLDSPLFSLHDTKWYISIFPNGDTSAKGWIGLFLKKGTSRKEHRVDFKLEIKNSDGSVLKAAETVYNFEINTHGRGYSTFIQRSALIASDAVSPEGTLTIFCSASIVDPPFAPLNNDDAHQNPPLPGPIEVMEATSNTSYQDSTSTLIRHLEDLCLNCHHADLTIQFKDKKFRAHKSILSCRSSVFNTELLQDKSSIEISDGDPDTFQDFLFFLYTGKFDNVSSRNAVSLYKYANTYGVQELKDECVRCMRNELCDDTFCDALTLALLPNEQGLLNVVTDYFVNNAKTICVTPQWENFFHQHPLLGNELYVKALNSKKNTEDE